MTSNAIKNLTPLPAGMTIKRGPPPVYVYDDMNANKRWHGRTPTGSSAKQREAIKANGDRMAQIWGLAK